MAEFERPKSNKKDESNFVYDQVRGEAGSLQEVMKSTRVQQGDKVEMQNPEQKEKGTKMQSSRINIKKIALGVGLAILILAIIGLGVGFGLKIKSLSRATIILNSQKTMTVQIASGGTITSITGQLQSTGLEAPIPFTFTSITLPGVSLNGRVLQQSKTINSIDYYHKDTETCVSFDLNFKAELRISIDTAADFVLQNSPDADLNSLEILPDLLKSNLVSDSSLQGRLNGAVDTSVSYDAVYDSTTQKFKILTQEDPYVKEQSMKIDPASESTLLKSTPSIKDSNNVKEVSAATANVVKEILNAVQNVVEVNKQIFDVQFKNSFKDEKEVKAASEAASKALGVIRGCCVVSQTILRCTKKVWESGELPVTNLQGSTPLQVPELIFRSQ